MNSAGNVPKAAYAEEWAESRLLQVFDQVSRYIEQGNVETALPILAGALCTVEDLVGAHSLLRSHPLHLILLEDPYTARAFLKPRGYAGDALIMDMIYDQLPPDSISARGRQLFTTTTAFPVAQAVRDRRKLATGLIEQSLARGDRICSLACGHMRELDHLMQQDLSKITAVDQDRLSVEFVRNRHNNSLDVREINVFSFLRQAIVNGDKFDPIYSLGFTDYCDQRAMSLLCKLMTRCLSVDGTIFVANFASNHLAQGWLEVCLDWQLTYRDELDMEVHAQEHGLTSQLWRDATESVIYSRMKRMN